MLQTWWRGWMMRLGRSLTMGFIILYNRSKISAMTRGAMASGLMDTCMTLSRKGPQKRGLGSIILGGMDQMDISMTLSRKDHQRRGLGGIIPGGMAQMDISM